MGQHEHTDDTRARTRRRLIGVGKAALVINLLDLTSSLPSAYNTAVGARSTIELVLQLALALVAVVWIGRALPGWLRTLNRAPIPRGPRYVIGLVLATQLVYVFFKIEAYPMTNVGMFTYGIKPWADVTRVRSRYVQDFDGELRPFSIRQTGDPLFHGAIQTDWETALIMIRHTRHKKVHDELVRLADEVGEPRPQLADMTLRFDADGMHMERVVLHAERRRQKREKARREKLRKQKRAQREQRKQRAKARAERARATAKAKTDAAARGLETGEPASASAEGKRGAARSSAAGEVD